MIEHEILNSLADDEEINGVPIVETQGIVSRLGVCPWDTAYLRSEKKCYAVSPNL